MKSCGCCPSAIGTPKADSPCWKSNGYRLLVTVAGSRLNIARAVNTPGPSFRCAIVINQLVEKNLSPPLALDCCSSRTNTFAWNMSIHEPFIIMSIGTEVEMGSALVPEPVWLKMDCAKVAGDMVIE